MFFSNDIRWQLSSHQPSPQTRFIRWDELHFRPSRVCLAACLELPHDGTASLGALPLSYSNRLWTLHIPCDRRCSFVGPALRSECGLILVSHHGLASTSDPHLLFGLWACFQFRRGFRVFGALIPAAKGLLVPAFAVALVGCWIQIYLNRTCYCPVDLHSHYSLEIQTFQCFISSEGNITRRIPSCRTSPSSWLPIPGLALLPSSGYEPKLSCLRIILTF